MIDINDAIQELIKAEPMEKSKWVKSMSTRMRIFNTQIFNNVYDGHVKDNAKMNYLYMNKTFNKLHAKGYFDERVTNDEYWTFVVQYSINLAELHYKEYRKFDVK